MQGPFGGIRCGLIPRALPCRAGLIAGPVLRRAVPVVPAPCPAAGLVPPACSAAPRSPLPVASGTDRAAPVPGAGRCGVVLGLPAGPDLAGPVCAGPVCAGPVFAGPVCSGLVLAGPALLRACFGRGGLAPGLFWPGRAWPGRFWPGRFWPGRFWPGRFWPGPSWLWRTGPCRAELPRRPSPLAARPVVASAASRTLKASWTTVPSASLTAVTLVSRPGLVSLSSRAARHSGHHAHSGASSGGSVVAVSHTSPFGCWFRPSAVRIWLFTWRPIPRVLDRMSHR